MTFALASDLHYEFHRDGGQTLTAELPDTEVIVVAGDLASAGCLWDSLVLLLGKYEHVVFVFGNHEFYGSSFQAVRQSIQKLRHRMPKMRRGMRLGELHLLDNSTCEIDGQRFVGTTMWFPREPGIEFKHQFLNDFNAIKGATRRIYEENEQALEFLVDTVEADDVVVTHHLPTRKSVHPRWQNSKYNCFYLCDVEALIHDRQPKVWCHGHTHDSMLYLVGRTRVVCNPFGYAAHEENPSFDSSLTIEP
jgi:Icc-related predicted phosphoesterase